MIEVPCDPSRAVEFIIYHAPKFAKAKAQRTYIENFLRSKKSLLMAKSTASSAAMKEVDAYGHPEYIELLDGLKAAVEEEETLKWLLTAAETRVDVWRTSQASARLQDRATQ
jgi:hypothetical protein